VIWIVYSLILTVLSPAALIILTIQHGWRRASAGWQERLALENPSPKSSSHGPRLWFHAASLGELEAAREVLKSLKNRHPGWFFCLTTLTPEAKALALRERMADEIRMAPLDLPFLVRKFIKSVNPQILVLVETELWPGLIRETKRAGQKILLINGRLSARGERRWAPLKPWVGKLLGSIESILVRTELDRRRFIHLGASPETTVTTGNLKLARAARRVLPEREDLRKRLALGSPQGPVIVAGSTWPGEEEYIVRAILPLRKMWPDLLLVMAPRRPERAPEVEQTLRAAGLSVIRRSRRVPQDPPQKFDCLLVDTLGELAELYGLGDVAIVGGSFLSQGGQSPIEPAAWGIPILFGPSMDNFLEVADELLKIGAARRTGPESLTTELERFLADGALRRTAGAAGRRFIDSQTQTLEKTVHAIETALQA
jgi:3-deoxy-D-manno-octulosonic-acid transferase